MNKITLVILAMVLCFTNTNAQKFNSGVEYLNYIGEQYGKISDDSWSYVRAASHSNSARKIEKRRKTVIATIAEVKRNISKIGGFGGNTSYKAAVVNFLTIDYQVMTEDYAKIVDMEEVADRSYDQMEAYMLAKEMANKKLDEAGNKVQEEQKRFAKENNITLNEGYSKRAEKVKTANLVYAHYNEIYLIFFKSSKQEMYLVDAMSRGDVNAMEQNKNSLKATVEEGMKKLPAVKTYKGDVAMVSVTRKVFKFYQQEVNTKMPRIIDFYVKKENFEKVQASFDQIKQSKRTQADIDKFNNALKEYNAGIAEFNQINDELNKTRSKLINEWNKAAENFTNKHVPRGK